MIVKFVHKDDLIYNGGAYQKKFFNTLAVEPLFRGEVLRGYNTVFNNKSISNYTSKDIISDTEIQVPSTIPDEYKVSWTSKTKSLFVVKLSRQTFSGGLFSFTTASKDYRVQFSSGGGSTTNIEVVNVTDTTTEGTYNLAGEGQDVFGIEQLSDNTINVFALNTSDGSYSTATGALATINVPNDATEFSLVYQGSTLENLITFFHIFTNYDDTEKGLLFSESYLTPTATLQDGLNFFSEESFEEADFPLECTADEDFFTTPPGSFDFALHNDLISNDTKEVLSNYSDYRAFIFEDERDVSDIFSGFINSVTYNRNSRIHEIDIIGATSVLSEIPRDSFEYSDIFKNYTVSNYRSFFDITTQETVKLVDIALEDENDEAFSLNAGSWVILSFIAIDPTDTTKLSLADAGAYIDSGATFEDKRKILQKYYNTFSLEAQLYNVNGILALRVDNVFVKRQWNYNPRGASYQEGYWDGDYTVWDGGTSLPVPISVKNYSYLQIIPTHRVEYTSCLYEIKANYFGKAQTNDSIQVQAPFGFIPTTEKGNVDSIEFPNSPEVYFQRLIGFANAYKDKYLDYLYPEDQMKRGFLTRIENIPKDLIVESFDNFKTTNFPESMSSFIGNQQYSLKIKQWEDLEWQVASKNELNLAYPTLKRELKNYTISPVFQNDIGANTVRVSFYYLRQTYKLTGGDNLKVATWYNSYSFDLSNGVIATVSPNEEDITFSNLVSGPSTFRWDSVWVQNYNNSNSALYYTETNNFPDGVDAFLDLTYTAIENYLLDQLKITALPTQYATFIGQDYILAEINWDKTVSGTTGEPLDSGTEYPALPEATIDGYQFAIYYTGEGSSELTFKKGSFSLMELFKAYQVYYNTSVEYKPATSSPSLDATNLNQITYKARIPQNQTPLVIELYDVTSEIIIVDNDVVSDALSVLGSEDDSNINAAIEKVENYYKPLLSGVNNLLKGVYLGTENLFLGREVEIESQFYYIIGIKELETGGFEVNLLEKWDV